VQFLVGRNKEGNGRQLNPPPPFLELDFFMKSSGGEHRSGEKRKRGGTRDWPMEKHLTGKPPQGTFSVGKGEESTAGLSAGHSIGEGGQVCEMLERA